MHSAARCAGHCATRSKSAYFLSDFARTPDIGNCCGSSANSASHVSLSKDSTKSSNSFLNLFSSANLQFAGNFSTDSALHVSLSKDSTKTSNSFVNLHSSANNSSKCT